MSEKSPIFGRRSSQIKLEPFDYKEAAAFVPNYSAEDKALAYGITGGVAKYLSMLNPKRSIHENIKRQFFSADGYLYEETRNLLVQEFSEVVLVNNIIEQIAHGANTVNEISQKLGESNSAILYSLDKLIGIGIVAKRNCITEEKNKKKTQYVLKDHMFKFWYKFIPRAVSVIEIGQGQLYYDKVVRSQLHDYMGSIFEEMCRVYTLNQGVAGAYGNFLTTVGTWWGTETVISDGVRSQQSADVDVVALSAVDKTMVLGECKFKNEKIGREVYETLLRRGSLFGAEYRVVRYLLFSLKGYTSYFDELDDDIVRLITVEDMYC